MDESIFNMNDNQTYDLADYYREQEKYQSEQSEKNDSRRKIEKHIQKFNSQVTKMNNHLDRIRISLVLESKKNLDLVGEIRDLTSELEEIETIRKELFKNIDAFRIETGLADFNMTPSEMNKKVNELKTRLVKLKRLQIAKYNARVEFIVNELQRLNGMSDLKPEVKQVMEKMVGLNLSKCDVFIRTWTQITYLNSINYNKLAEAYNFMDEIIGLLNIPKKEVQLDAEIQHVDNKIETIESEIKENMTAEEIIKLNENVSVVNDLVYGIKTKVENKKEDISDEEYKEYLSKYEKCEGKFKGLKEKISRVVGLNEVQKKFANEIGILNDEIKLLGESIKVHDGSANKEIIESDKKKISELEGKVNELKEKIKIEYNKSAEEKQIDVNQYNIFVNKIQGMIDELSAYRSRLKDPGMIKGADIFAILIDEIDDLDQTLKGLKEQLDGLEKPIKDKKIRKDIDIIIEHLSNDINDLENILERYKDKDSEKYAEAITKLNEKKEELNNISTKYRGMCPLRVKTVKSAKQLYKKHNKKILIAAGLASFALIGYNVLIPAIMHGNIMVAFTSPALRPIAKFFNKILGSFVGATKDVNGVWRLANGVMINPSVAVTSLLKGLAISGINSAALVAPVIVSIKKLNEKMKVKQILVDTYKKGKDVVKDTAGKVKNKVKDTVSDAKNTVKNKVNEIANNISDSKEKKNYDILFAKYLKFSSQYESLEDFCEKEKLTVDDLKALKIKEKKKLINEEETQIIREISKKRRG